MKKNKNNLKRKNECKWREGIDGWNTECGNLCPSRIIREEIFYNCFYCGKPIRQVFKSDEL